MNILCAIVSVLIIHIGIIECNNSSLQITGERIARYCYFCANCPRPFDPYSPYVSQSYSSTGWCTTMSATNSPSAIATRGVAQPGLCSSNGCSYKVVSGVNTWVCCCNQDLCNGNTPTTTPRPVGNTCYFCSTCPMPFDRYSNLVSDVYSATGWCAKMSSTSSPNAIATRGAAPPGICTSRGCSSKVIVGVSTWVCCCNGYRCNSGIPTSKSTMSMLSVALMITVMVRKSF